MRQRDLVRRAQAGKFGQPPEAKLLPARADAASFNRVMSRSLPSRCSVPLHL